MDTSLAVPQRILVPTDFSKSAESARLQARHVAARHDAELHVLHVTREERPWMRSRPSLSSSPPVLPSFHPSSEVSAFATPTPFAVRPALSAVDGILDYAEDHDVDLVVMGTHGERGVRSALLGSTAERIVRRAYPPVLTVRAALDRPLDGRLRRILVPIDFSEATPSLVAHARHVAASWNADVLFVHVIETPRFPAFFRMDAHRADLPALATRAQQQLRRVVDAVDGPDVPVQHHVLTGSPAPMIVAFASVQRADAILMATHGWTGLQRFLLGSVAEQVIRTAPCPVVTIKGYGMSLVERANAPDERAAGARESGAPAGDRASSAESNIDQPPPQRRPPIAAG